MATSIHTIKLKNNKKWKGIYFPEKSATERVMSLKFTTLWLYDMYFVERKSFYLY